jgi:hypothetical protein
MKCILAFRYVFVLYCGAILVTAYLWGNLKAQEI